MMMNRKIGTIFAMVAIVFSAAACLTPRRIMKCTAHRMIDDRITATTVLPWPNTWRKRPRVDMIRTK